MSSSQEGKPSITHIIFELDGILFDTPAIAAQIYTEIVNDYNKGPIPIELLHRLQGRNEKDITNLLINELRLPIRFPLVSKKINEKEDAMYLRTKMNPGAERLIGYFRKNKIPMAIATGSRKEAVDFKTRNYGGILINIHHIVNGSDPDVPKGKPDPTIFNVCMDRFDDPKPTPETCLVFEGSPAGVNAACCAGIKVVMMPGPDMDPKYQQSASSVINSLNDFDPEEFGLPPIKPTA